MNDYRITGKAGGLYLDDIITERDEKAACLACGKRHAPAPVEITSITLLRENVTATKEQEREALDKIRAMVEELGPESYLKTAFDGCFEDAEENINYDAGSSWKARAQSAQRQLVLVGKKLDEACEGLDEQRKQIEVLSEKAAAVENGILPVGLHDGIQHFLEEQVRLVTMSLSDFADVMADHAEEPECGEFRVAVEGYRSCKVRVAELKALLGGLDKVKTFDPVMELPF